jgi:hypothetical protein
LLWQLLRDKRIQSLLEAAVLAVRQAIMLELMGLIHNLLLLFLLAGAVVETITYQHQEKQVVLVVGVLLVLVLVEQAIPHLEAHRKDLQVVMASPLPLILVAVEAVLAKQAIRMLMVKAAMVLHPQFQGLQQLTLAAAVGVDTMLEGQALAAQVAAVQVEMGRLQLEGLREVLILVVEEVGLELRLHLQPMQEATVVQA